MAKYSATTEVNGQTVAFVFFTHFLGILSECRECKNYFLVENLNHDEELQLLSLRRLQTELFAGLPICPDCMKKVAARFGINLTRE